MECNGTRDLSAHTHRRDMGPMASRAIRSVPRKQADVSERARQRRPRQETATDGRWRLGVSPDNVRADDDELTRSARHWQPYPITRWWTRRLVWAGSCFRLQIVPLLTVQCLATVRLSRCGPVGGSCGRPRACTPGRCHQQLARPFLRSWLAVPGASDGHYRSYDEFSPSTRANMKTTAGTANASAIANFTVPQYGPKYSRPCA